MTRLRWLKLPFKYTTTEDFRLKLSQWLTSIFYDVLPKHGFEVREEQIYTSLRMADALLRRKPLFAEAGSGTGKTFAYLLPALCYARMTGRPFIVSVASTTLQQQLLADDGDIATLSRLLKLDIELAFAKDPVNYLCDAKLETVRYLYGTDADDDIAKVLNWASITTTGDRAEIPDLPAETWKQVSWDSSLRCDSCYRRGYCRLARMRRSLWESVDFIVCSHEYFFRDLWSRREYFAASSTYFRHFAPLSQDNNASLTLPPYCGVVFDEGHLIEEPAISTMGQALKAETLREIIEGITTFVGLREELLQNVETVDRLAAGLFATVASSAAADFGEKRHRIGSIAKVKQLARDLLEQLVRLQDNLVLEIELHRKSSIDFSLSIFQDRLESFSAGLQLLAGTQETVVWWQPADSSLWVLPRRFADMLGSELLKQNIPVVFTSATLATEGSFDTMASITGVKNALTSIVDTSFNLPQQATVEYHCDLCGLDKDQWLPAAAKRCRDLLIRNGGRALVLCSRPDDLEYLRSYFESQKLPLPLLFEGDGDSGWLVSRFRNDRTSVLVGTAFWEGLDAPGDALTLVVVFDLPYPPHDPLVAAKREAAVQRGHDPDLAVDLPAMLLKLRQGFGRLIRKRTDSGTIAILARKHVQLADRLPRSWASCLVELHGIQNRS